MGAAVTGWRSRRIALLALAVTALAAFGAYVWLDVLPSVRESERVVSAERNADVAGQRLTLDGARWDEYDAPDGMRTLSVRMTGGGGPDSELCAITTLTDRPTGRTWLPSRDGLDVPYDEGERSCIASPDSYRILLVFLVPDETAGPFDLDIGGRDEVARFVVDP